MREFFEMYFPAKQTPAAFAASYEEPK